ncbi:hypothetical protein BDW42DRAFT_173307 [Aspergillus taichungensis]|uniref:Uncharacterized protein n=1 Tax=Aspergillus taichungensis TaxID=482145 RepID=A0A2J5HPY3_9EURO|nr:hypothetical protein BDW42DRAFT_173307 [Aspergillus taichungensis]
MAVLVVILMVRYIYLLLLHFMPKLYVGTRTYDLDKVFLPLTLKPDIIPSPHRYRSDESDDFPEVKPKIQHQRRRAGPLPAQ